MHAPHRQPEGERTPEDLLNEAATRRLGHEYRSRSLYRVCGGSLLTSAGLFALSLLAGGDVLPATGPGLRAAATALHVALLWLATLAPALAAGALLAIARHYRGTSREGWVLLAFAGNAVGAALLTLAFALGAVAAPAVLAATRGGDPAAARATALAPLTLVSASAGEVGGMLFWLSFVPLSMALTRDRLWPRVAAWGAAVTGIAQVLGAPLLSPYPAALTVLRLVGYAYLTVLGLATLRMVKIMRAAAAATARVED